MPGSVPFGTIPGSEGRGLRISCWCFGLVEEPRNVRDPCDRSSRRRSSAGRGATYDPREKRDRVREGKSPAEPLPECRLAGRLALPSDGRALPHAGWRGSARPHRSVGSARALPSHRISGPVPCRIGLRWCGRGPYAAVRWAGRRESMTARGQSDATDRWGNPDRRGPDPGRGPSGPGGVRPGGCPQVAAEGLGRPGGSRCEGGDPPGRGSPDVLAGAPGGHHLLRSPRRGLWRHDPGTRAEPRLARVGSLAPYRDAIGLAAIAMLITLATLVAGNLVPRRIALHRPESIARLVSRPVRALAILAGPWSGP